jgi:hypothetical protein
LKKQKDPWPYAAGPHAKSLLLVIKNCSRDYILKFYFSKYFAKKTNAVRSSQECV